MEIHEILQNLDNNDIAQLVNLTVKKVQMNKSFKKLEEDFSVLSNFDTEDNANFGRLLLALIASQENEIGVFVSDKIKKMSVAGESRAGSTAIDIIYVAGILLPLIQSKVRIYKDKKTGWTFEIGWNSENTIKLMKAILKPIEILASKVKNLTVGNVKIESSETSDKEEKK